uniref:Uncharacterized protein n=1 Tax=Pristhesancus plagipennis TaxID=1955184 RepID=A0A2K8JLV3_PRIPG|nr:secreted hypothetical protein [Pristhesancus plagipennis]
MKLCLAQTLFVVLFFLEFAFYIHFCHCECTKGDMWYTRGCQRGIRSEKLKYLITPY